MHKIVQRFGNSGHIVLPKEYIGKKVKLLLARKTIPEIQMEVMQLLQPYLREITGLYLYGSYARNEASAESDIDVLVVAARKIKVLHQEYSFTWVTLEELEHAIEKTQVLILPILREAIPLVNPSLLQQHQHLEFTRSNMRKFLQDCRRMLEMQKKGMALQIDVGSLVYSLILRLRSLYIMKTWHEKQYTKAGFFDLLQEWGIKKNKIQELYHVYSLEKSNIAVRESELITSGDIQQLMQLMEKLIQELGHEQKKV